MDPTAASESWVSIKGYKDAVTAATAADTLARFDIPCQVTDEVDRGNGYQLRVAPERAEDARSALADNPVSESELSQLALQDPAPDDFDPAARPGLTGSPDCRECCRSYGGSCFPYLARCSSCR